MCSKPRSVAEPLFDDGLLTAGLGRQRMRDLRGLLQLVDKIPQQQLLDAIDRIIGDALEDIVPLFTPVRNIHPHTEDARNLGLAVSHLKLGG